MCRSSWWDFDDDSADTDTLLRKVLPLCESDNSTNLADNSRSCRRLFSRCFDGWDVSLATNLSVSLLIWTMIHIQECLMEYLPLHDMSSCENFVVEICSLEVRLVYYTLPLVGGGIKRCFCLTSLWRLSRTSSVTREQRWLGGLKLAQW